MKTRKINLGRIVLTVLFAIQFSVLTTGCKYLEGNELLNTEDAAETENVPAEITEEVAVIDSVEIRKEQVLAIAEVKWKSERYQGEYMKLSHPTVENGVVKGTIELQRSWKLYTGTYEKLSENNYSIIFNNQNGIDFSETFSMSIEPIDDGNSILGKWYDKGSETPNKTEKFVRE